MEDAWSMASSARSRRLPNSPFNRAEPAPAEQFEVGERVTHDRYGLGRVTRVDGDGAVHVDFGSVGGRIVTTTSNLHKL